MIDQRMQASENGGIAPALPRATIMLETCATATATKPVMTSSVVQRFSA
jgi:hypothetical protein